MYVVYSLKSDKNQINKLKELFHSSTQEVIDLGGEAISSTEYTHMGTGNILLVHG